MKWTELQRARITGKEADVPWWVNDKIRFNEFCRRENLPVPEIFRVWKHPSEVDLTGIGASFVLKPSVLHSAQGVMVLTRDQKDPEIFFDSLSKRRLTENQLREEQTRLYDSCKFKGAYKIFIEEKVVGDDNVGDIPLDYKIFTFYGEPQMVFQFNRNVQPKRAAWFDGDFRPLRLKENIISSWKIINHGVHLLPRHWRSMLDIASLASRAVKTPFISVDMYAAAGGPLIGEMTPAPGGPYYGEMYKFSESFDRFLGRCWADAVERINISI